MSVIKKYLEKLPIKREYYFRAALCFCTIVILTYLFPREKKFKYEFQKNKPWAYEVLVAPFDFPIAKSNDDIQSEKDSLIRNFKYYFNLNNNTQNEVIQNFTNEFNTKWIAFSMHNPTAAASVNKYEIEKAYQASINHVYKNGLIENTDLSGSEGWNDREIMVVLNKYAEPRSVSNIFSLKSAYEYIKSQIEIQEQSNANIRLLTNSIHIESLLKPNLTFDQETSTRALNDKISNISESKGMVQAGERIIFTGDIVNNMSFRILKSLKEEYESRELKFTEKAKLVVGQCLISITLVLSLFYYLQFLRKDIIKSYLHTSFIFFLLVLFAVVARILINYNNISIMLFPIAMFPVIMRTFFDARMANFSLFVLIILLSFWVHNSFEFIYLSFIAGVTANYSLSRSYHRSRIFLTAIAVFMVYCISYFAYVIITEGTIDQSNITDITYFGVNSLLILSTLPLIYIMEKLFGFVSDSTLLELSDTNQNLLRKLAEVAPGTFQHSLQVANLAEDAVFQIGGNPLLVRAGALYHDIGKIESPVYFIENQYTGYNPHKDLPFAESAKFIISHVEHGVNLAIKYNLPEQIIDFIRSHHGNSTVHFFYRSHLRDFPDDKISKSKFSYSGPLPNSKETAVLMMADAVEAASRSLKSNNETTIAELVENIINEQLYSGQFNQADITFADISLVKSLFKQRLRNMYHKRIEYPKMPEESVNQSDIKQEQ
jgi:putative nucleotidyltransferase with HDIG domain